MADIQSMLQEFEWRISLKPRVWFSIVESGSSKFINMRGAGGDVCRWLGLNVHKWKANPKRRVHIQRPRHQYSTAAVRLIRKLKAARCVRARFKLNLGRRTRRQQLPGINWSFQLFIPGGEGLTGPQFKLGLRAFEHASNRFCGGIRADENFYLLAAACLFRWRLTPPF